jgi:Uma2 family endonuclease
MLTRMLGRAALERRNDEPTEDHVVFLDGVSWSDYERLLAMRGDRSAPRITYLEGTVEIMSPSRSHETIKSLIARLVEAYCYDAEIPFMPVGSWTLKKKSSRRGAEPDECYLLGTGHERSERPDLAIEVVWTSGRIDKLDVYRKLGVKEVWFWRKGRIVPYRLRGERYVALKRSVALPKLDLELIADHLHHPTVNDAIRAFRAARARAAR